MTFEEEIVTLQQFLRFGETKSIVELMALQDKEGQAVIVPTTRTNSDIRSFIESSTQRPVHLPAKAEAPGCSNGHHFETLVNSMALMLPLQLLNSVPAPLLSSGSDSSHQDTQTRHETPDVSLDGTLFNAGPVRAEMLLDAESPKMESEEFNVSGNSSPSTPCTSSITSEMTHMSPENKVRCEERSGSLKKGRVFCSACEKTFYDKGTLKIHYNAVHLKIKHKCTIEGCNMVFSSLRSRNRHSANPNPRCTCLWTAIIVTGTCGAVWARGRRMELRARSEILVPSQRAGPSQVSSSATQSPNFMALYLAWARVASSFPI